MFIVIQEIQLKKPDKRGAYKEWKVNSSSFQFVGTGVMQTRYSYYPDYDKGRFGRPIQKAYRISVHQSNRVDGKVKKTQCVLGTIKYYDLADDDAISWYGWLENGFEKAVEMFDAEFDPLYDMVKEKIDLLQKKIKKEFHRTEEYKAVQKVKKIQKAHKKAKTAFAKKYGVLEDDYDRCYNIFGEVMNQTFLDQTIRAAQARQSYNSSYYKSQWNNYSDSNTYGQYDYKSLFQSTADGYSEDERDMLKQFYKALSVKFHPDSNRDKDTTREMQLINKLKQEWGI